MRVAAQEFIKEQTHTRWWRTLSPDQRVFTVGFLMVLPFYLAPLFATRFLPGLDLPFHLALVDMLGKVDAPASPYHQIYDGGLRVSPYMAHLGALHLLSRLIPINAAHKLIMGCYVAGLPLSTAYLLSRCGRSRVPALLGFVLVYNMTVHYGFISFAISVPVLLGMLGLLASVTAPATAQGKSVAWPAAALCLTTMLLFLCHLQNYLFGLCAAAVFIAFSGGTPLRRRLLAGACLVPSLLGLIYWDLTTRLAANPARQRTGAAYALKLLWDTRKGDARGHPWLHLVDRVRAFPDHLLRGFVDRVDRQAAVALLLGLLLYVVLGVLGRRRPLAGMADSKERPARMQFAGVVVVLGGVLAYLALPHHLREFELMTFYPRLAVMVAALLPLLVPAGLLRYPPRVLYALAVPAVAVSLWYGVEVTRHYRSFARETADFADVLDRVPPGGRALGLVYDRTSRVMANESLLVGLPSYYPVEHPGMGSLVRILYCGMRHMPCRLKQGASEPPDPGAWAPQSMDLGRAVPYFDYFFARSAPPPQQLFGPFADRIQQVARSGSWVVYRKMPGAVFAPPAPNRFPMLPDRLPLPGRMTVPPPR